MGAALLCGPTERGIPRDFVDRAGLCSSGRWDVARRRLPDVDVAKRFQKALIDGLLKCERKLQEVDESIPDGFGVQAE